MPPARGPNVPDAQPIYLVDLYGNPIMGAEATIEAFIRNGQGFSANTGFQTNVATGNFALSIFNPAANTKNALIYSIIVIEGATISQVQCNFTTTDPAYGTPAVVLNCNPKGPGSSLSTVSYAATTQTLGPAGTVVVARRIPVNTDLEMLTNGRVILLPAGSANGLTTFTTPTGASNWEIIASWVEF